MTQAIPVDASRRRAAKKLHALIEALRAAGLMPGSEARTALPLPWVVSWHSKGGWQSEGGRVRLQAGAWARSYAPAAMSRPATRAGNSEAVAPLPAEATMLAALQVLTVGNWLVLGNALLDQTFPSGYIDLKSRRAIEMAICVQDRLILPGGARALHAVPVVMLRSSLDRSRAVVYGFPDTGPVLLGTPVSESFKPDARATLAPVALSGAEPQEATGDVEALERELRWRYESALGNHLAPELQQAFARMCELGQRVALATSEARFDDAANIPNWLAVRVDAAYWENGGYFESAKRTLSAMPGAVQWAHALLLQLMDSRLLERFTQAYALKLDDFDVLGLFVEDGACWVAISSSNGDSGPAYRVDPETGATTLVGLAKRFDWDIFHGAVPMLTVLTLDEVLTRARERRLYALMAPDFVWSMPFPWWEYDPQDDD